MLQAPDKEGQNSKKKKALKWGLEARQKQEHGGKKAGDVF